MPIGLELNPAQLRLSCSMLPRRVCAKFDHESAVASQCVLEHAEDSDDDDAAAGDAGQDASSGLAPPNC